MEESDLESYVQQRREVVDKVREEAEHHAEGRERDGW